MRKIRPLAGGFAFFHVPPHPCRPCTDDKGAAGRQTHDPRQHQTPGIAFGDHKTGFRPIIKGAGFSDFHIPPGVASQAQFFPAIGKFIYRELVVGVVVSSVFVLTQRAAAFDVHHRAFTWMLPRFSLKCTARGGMAMAANSAVSTKATIMVRLVGSVSLFSLFPLCPPSVPFQGNLFPLYPHLQPGTRPGPYKKAGGLPPALVTLPESD